MPIRGGNLKKRLQAGETVVGPFVIVPSVTMIDTLGYSGMDFCIIDTEHGPISKNLPPIWSSPHKESASRPSSALATTTNA